MSNNLNHAVITASAIGKTYDDSVETQVLNGVSLTLNASESIAIVGASGSGKSTLLQILGGLDKPTTGQVHVANKNIHAMSVKASGDWRNKHLGFVYQFHHLLPEFSALENVAMPLMIRGKSVSEAQVSAKQWLKKVGLGHRLQHKPGQLSGGERQRAAIARALVTEPTAVLADEPTGNLDTKTANQVFDVLLDIKQSLSTSFVIVTHDMRLAEKMDRVLTLQDGTLQSV